MMTKNKFHTYLRKITDSEFLLSYSIKSNKPLSEWDYDASYIKIKELSFGLYEATIKKKDPSDGNGIIIKAKVDSNQSTPSVAHKGIIMIKNRKKGDNIKISLKRSGGVGGNGSTIHYGDADA